MSIGVVTRKLLWGRSRNQCAFQGCPQELTLDLDDPESRILGDAGAVIGEEAHIRSGRPEGPRYDAEYPMDEIDSYANLIPLCPTHHTIVDKDRGRGYSVTELEAMKVAHESAVRAAESPADERLRLLSERVAASIQLWEERMVVADWQSFTWHLNYPVPLLPDRFRRSILTTAEWLLAKDWPQEFPRLREALDRFAEVLSAMLAHILENFTRGNNEERWELDRAYKRISWNPELYEELIAQFRTNCTVTWCLVVELTRAANLVVRAIREEIDTFYRFDEGMLLVGQGDGVLVNQIFRLEYEGRNWGDQFLEIDLDSWKTSIMAEALLRKEPATALSPFEMLARFASDSASQASGLPAGDS